MGIVEKQSIKGSFFSYVGVVVGFVTAGLLQPIIFTKAENGVLELITSWSLVFATLATLGLNNVTNRLFPWFRNPSNHHHGFYGLLFWVTIAGTIISLIVYLFLRPWIIADSEAQGSLLFIRYMDWIIPLTIFTAIYLVTDIYYAVLLNAVKGIFLREFLMRVFILAGFLVFTAGWCGFGGAVILYAIALSVPGILITVSLIRDGEFVIRPDRAHFNREMTRSLVSVASYGLIIAFSNIMILYIDRIMVNSFLGLEATGLYGRVFIFGSLVSIPNRAVSKISAAVVAQLWKEDNHQEINRLYRDTSLHQLLFALLIFVGIWGNIGNIFHILPDSYEEGKWVIFWIGLANLFIMASGISGSVMTTSSHYRMLALFVILFGGLVILTNLLLIPAVGITGAAIASAISTFAYALMRYLFLLIRYRMQPYTWRHAAALLVAVAAYLPALLIPDLNNDAMPILTLLLDIGVRSLAIALVFVAITLIFKVSPDLNRRWAQASGFLRSK
ncbi:MAG: polysaccharide biosynthesis C-terminal domain-containing protein [Bacteroidales bacterium]